MSGLWEGASYHRCQEFRDFLTQLNQGQDGVDGKVHCLRFAPTPQKKTRLTTLGSPTGAAANAPTVPVFQLHQETIGTVY
ncbi:MAG: hypothetical protein BRC54_13120 [Cyanobacteria bacterium SW_7_48_12]|nr:MAG: hypothetical protein BRC54_13120 [Cyanobacteria bacterium SW_7_48_12]